jgi:hypothetical protein
MRLTQNFRDSRSAPFYVAPWLPALLRPSDDVLRKISGIWDRANNNSKDLVSVVLVQLRLGGHTHSYNLLNETGEAKLYACALDLPLVYGGCHRVAFFIAADKQSARARAAERLSVQNCSSVLHFEGPIVRSGDDLNRETDEGGFSPVQIDDVGKPRTIEGIDLAWSDWWVAAYSEHAVLTDRSSYAFSARLFAIGSVFLRHAAHEIDRLERSFVDHLNSKIPVTVSNSSYFCLGASLPSFATLLFTYRCRFGMILRPAVGICGACTPSAIHFLVDSAGTPR